MTRETKTINVGQAQNFLEKLRTSLDVQVMADLVHVDIEALEQEINMSIAEAIQTITILHGLDLKENAHILEVGAGFGFASVALASFGFHLTALEPGGIGFNKNRIFAAHIFGISDLEVVYLDSTAEQTDFSVFPKFDLIVSNNVLEHVQDVNLGLNNLAGALDETGIMVHSCPNYIFPFEPHFGIPLIPIFPQMTRFFLPRRIVESGLWKSLNFVTYWQVRSFAKRQNLFVAFERGVMTSSILRLKSDTEFAQRHRLLARMAGNHLLFALLKRMLSLPLAIATPMNFVVARNLPALGWSTRQWRVTTSRQ
jgi:2-polyprenyl-3-methyl-5-hydroxy-6-metoxy-1,4-benzoquinol methylase